jgi:hypothetical protein
VSSVDQAVIDLVEGVSIWGVPGLVVDSFLHEVRTFDRHLPAWWQSRPVLGHFHLYYHAGCACLSLADVAFASPITIMSSHDFGRLCMPASAVHKIHPWPPLLSQLLVQVC